MSKIIKQFMQILHCAVLILLYIEHIELPEPFYISSNTQFTCQWYVKTPFDLKLSIIVLFLFQA